MSRCFSCDPSFGCFTAGSCRKGEPELRATISTLTEERDDLSTRLATAQRERDDARVECERLRERLVEREAQLDAHRGKLDSDCVEHVELNGHLDIAEQALDWMAHEIRDDAFDTKVQDFRASLRIVIDQCVKQRLRGNWYIASYDAGRAKLVEHWQAKTAEAIAAWLEGKATAHGERLRKIKAGVERGDCDEHGWAESYGDGWADDIRRGKWRPSPATDKEEP